jgi:hypothetical protein
MMLAPIVILITLPVLISLLSGRSGNEPAAAVAAQSESHSADASSA